MSKCCLYCRVDGASTESNCLAINQQLTALRSLAGQMCIRDRNDDVERGAIETMSNYLDIEKLTAAPRLNGAKKRSKFAGIVLPDFSVQTAGSSK